MNKNDKNQLIPEEVETIGKTETEEQLENLLLNNPELLMPGLEIIGRQTPADGKFLDLLGVDENGGLVVFELKRGTLYREAVAQIVDYTSYLSSLDRESLFKHISDNSANLGKEEKIDFESWYQEEFSGNMEALDDSPRMVLIGLGADDKTKRMVNFLAQNDVDMSLITFYAFKKDNQMFLAKQVEIRMPEKVASQRKSYTKSANLEKLNNPAKDLNVTDMLEKVADFIREEMDIAYIWPGIESPGFSLLEKAESGTSTYRVYITIYLDKKRKGEIRLLFQLRAVELAKDSFKKVKEKYKNIKTTNSGIEVCFGDKDRILKCLEDSEISDHVNISFVERQNLTRRLNNRRLTRKTLGFSKIIKRHINVFEIETALYHLCKPNRGLTIETET